ncbi:MAG: hypothetical protein EU549_03420 [Promethearchaeota archaeon]|nr:MAG: hypothetical protein EU549_03420 [Candidatus Lokiarchaeota archaeon]
MQEIKNIIDDLSIAALENSTHIAAFAVISNSSELIYQTKNFNLEGQTDIIFNVLNGDDSYIINNLEFNVIHRGPDGIIATNNAGMGYAIIVPFEGGILVSFAMPKADTNKTLAFIKEHIKKLDGKI